MSSGVISFNVGSQMNPMWCWTLAIYVTFPTNMKVCYGVKNKISGIFQLAGRGKGIWAGHAVYHYTIHVVPLLSPTISLLEILSELGW